MKVLEIFENEVISLDDEDVKSLLQIKNQSIDLPFFLRENKFTTKDYIIGEIQLKDTLIRIKPRHKVLSLNHYFEMLLYIDSLNCDFIVSSSHSNNALFGVNSLIENFIEICKGLLGFGLTGFFSRKKLKSFRPKGMIIFSEYNKQLISTEGVPILIDEYDVDIYANQIIKKAILKIQGYDGLSKESDYLIKEFLNHLVNISDYKEGSFDLELEMKSFYSSNPYYPIALEYALKIISDFKLGYSSELGVQWNAFLVNSNDIFEKYVRKILRRDLGHEVTKWEKPKKFAEINWEKQTGEKSFSPDVIIDFFDGKANAVFDIKNKSFAPRETNLSELVSVADIYQLLFYSKQLNTDICGLIYPADDFYWPIALEIQGLDLHFFLVSINMNEDLKKRNELLVENIKCCLKYT